MLLSKRIQARIIAALLNCQSSHVDPDQLEPPWSAYYEWIAEGPDDETPAERWDAFAQEWIPRADEHEAHYRLLLSVREDPGYYPSAADLLDHLPALTWLWPGWLPRGLLSLLVAEPGTGKSYLALDLCRRVIDGASFPDGTTVTDPGPALYVDAEDTPQVFRERLATWSAAQRARLYYLRPHPRRLMINLSDAEDRDGLLEAVYQVRPRLVVIDSYGSVTLRGENAKEDVQQLLSFLSKVAIDYDTAMLVIHHLRKRSEAQLSLPGLRLSIDAIRGSSHIPAMARNVLGMHWSHGRADLDRNSPRTLEVIKSNLGPYPDPIGVYFEPHPDEPSLALLRYGEPPAGEQPSKIDECAAWLLDLLSQEGSVSPAEIVELAEYECFSRATVYRARKQLADQVVNTAGRRDPGNCWALTTET